MAKSKFKKPQAKFGKKAAKTPMPAVPPNASLPAAQAGMGNSSQPVAPTGDAVDSSDPIIAKVQDAVRAKLPPQFRVAVQRIVLAGMKVMFSPETHQLMLNAIQSDTDPAHAAGMGVTQLITILYKESKGSMPIPAIVPAGILLVCEALDFMEKSKMVQMTPQVMDEAVQTVSAYLLQKLGFTPQSLVQMSQGKPPFSQAAGAPAQAAAGPAQTQPAAAAPPAAGGAPAQGLIGQNMGAQ